MRATTTKGGRSEDRLQRCSASEEEKGRHESVGVMVREWSESNVKMRDERDMLHPDSRRNVAESVQIIDIYSHIYIVR